MLKNRSEFIYDMAEMLDVKKSKAAEDYYNAKYGNVPVGTTKEQREQFTA